MTKSRVYVCFCKIELVLFLLAIPPIMNWMFLSLLCLLCPPLWPTSNSYLEELTPNVIIFGDVDCGTFVGKSGIGDDRVEGCVLIFSCENTQIATSCWITINRRMLEPTKKDTPWPRAKEKPQWDGRRGTIMFKIKPHIRQRSLEGTNKPSCAPGPRERSSDTHRRLSPTCL